MCVINPNSSYYFIAEATPQNGCLLQLNAASGFALHVWVSGGWIWGDSMGGVLIRSGGKRQTTRKQ